jgi:general secretion pathway protein G
MQRTALISLLAVLNFIGAAASAAAALPFMAVGVARAPLLILVGLGLACLAAAQVACGIGLWRLKSWGRAIQIGLAIAGLVAVPPGTLVGIILLYYLTRPHVKLRFSGRPAETLSAEEQQLLQSASETGVLIALVLSVVLAFWGLIIGAIAIPNFLNAVDRGKQKRTIADIRSIATAIESYAIEHDVFPRASSIDELAPSIQPVFIRVLPRADGWGNRLQVLSSHNGYVIQSAGKDGVFEASPPMGARPDFNDDVIFSDGEFIQWPEWAGQ